VDNLFNQTQQMGGFPLTSYDLTDIGEAAHKTPNDFRGNAPTIPPRDPLKTNKFTGTTMRAGGTRGQGLRFSQDGTPGTNTSSGLPAQ